MTPEQRISLTRYIWTTLLITIAAIILLAGKSLSGLIIPIIIFLVGGAIPITGFVLNWGAGLDSDSSQSTEKSKRDAKLDKMLERLSDEEREALRQRLAYDEQPYGIGEDGELVYIEDN